MPPAPWKTTICHQIELKNRLFSLDKASIFNHAEINDKTYHHTMISSYVYLNMRDYSPNVCRFLRKMLPFHLLVELSMVLKELFRV